MFSATMVGVGALLVDWGGEDDGGGSISSEELILVVRFGVALDRRALCVVLG